MGHITWTAQTFLTQKERQMLYTISIHYLEFAIFAILTSGIVIDLHRGVEWDGSFSLNFQKGSRR